MLRHSTKIMVILLMGLFLSSTAVLAQEQTCPEIVRTALDSTNEQCSATGRNQVCYGNVNLEAAPQPGVADFNFSVPGDRVSVSAVKSLSLSSRIEEDKAWGVALMQLQANLPGNLPGQNVTFLLFGAVEITNGVETNTESMTFDITALGDVNVYEEPSIDAPIVTNLIEGDLMVTVGRNNDGTWLYIDESGITGWVLAEEVQPSGNIQTLNTLGAEGLPPTPMQAFYFQSGLGDAPCPEAPDSGILVQTPEGASQIQFTVNAVNITLGSTAYFQAQPSGEMTTSVLEGQATVEAGGVSVTVPAGSMVRVPLDANGVAAGPPSDPEPYDAAKMAVLPIRVLPLDIDIAAPIAEGTAEPPSGGSIMLTGGEWVWTAGTPSGEGCPAGALDFTVANFTPAGPFQLPGGEFNWEIFSNAAYGQPLAPTAVFSNPEPNTYIMEIPIGSASWHYELRIVDSEYIEGFFESVSEGCTILIPFEITVGN